VFQVLRYLRVRLFEVSSVLGLKCLRVRIFKG